MKPSNMLETTDDFLFLIFCLMVILLGATQHLVLACVAGLCASCVLIKADANSRNITIWEWLKSDV